MTSQPLKIVKTKEPWCEYTLEDGTVLRFRVMVHNVRRIEGGFAANGDPEYQFANQMQCEVVALEALRRAGEPVI